MLSYDLRQQPDAWGGKTPCMADMRTRGAVSKGIAFKVFIATNVEQQL